MTDTIDAHPSEEFPDRPDHEDFRILAEAIQIADRAAENGIPIDVIVDIDMPSLEYIVEQRMRRVLQALPPLTNAVVRADPKSAAYIISMWVDGFHAGMELQKRRPNEAGTAGEGSAQ